MSNRKRKSNESLVKYHKNLKTEQKVIDNKIAGRLLWHSNAGMCARNDIGKDAYIAHPKALAYEKTRRGAKAIVAAAEANKSKKKSKK